MGPRGAFLWLLVCVGACAAADVSGNWVFAEPSTDGYVRKTYFNLKQEGSRITGTIRTRQFFYTIAESTGGPEGFTVTGTMKDGSSERRAGYEGMLVGEELRIAERRNGTLQAEMIAHRTAPTDGAMPAKLPLPSLHEVRDNGLVRTPPMGWNSWNKFAGRVSDEIVRGVADAMAANGMRDAGYVYINIDDTWEGERDAQGNIRSNNKFPDMKALADYVHAKGLKLGIYSSPGPNTCAGYEGSYGHEDQDASTFAAWGIDYLKYDWCGARNLYSDAEMQAVYQKMGDALWSMLAAPLIAGNDVRSMPQSIADILMNREVIGIDQDKAGKQARRVSKSGDQEIWMRLLANGDRAIALFNRSGGPAEMAVNWAALGISQAPATVRDLWAHRDIRVGRTEYKVTVPSHGVVMWRAH